jgi:peptidyl-prolyl cis-trans isomerase C
MKMFTRTATGVLLLVLLFFSACSSSGGSITITQEQLNDELDRLVAQYQSQGQPISAEQLDQMRGSLLNQMIERELLVAAAEADGQELSDEELDAEIDSVRAQFGSEEAFQEVIAQYGYTEERLRDEIGDAMLIQKYIDNVILASIEVSDDEMLAFYNDNPSYFETPETVTASHILVQLEEGADAAQRTAAEEKINEVARLLAEGADFAEVAREYSEGPSAPSGGDLGEFTRGQMVPPFEAAVFALEVGEISGVVETQFGLHLIYLRDRTEAGLIDFETASESIRNYLVEQKEGEAIAEEIERLRENYTLDVPEV